MQSAGPKDTEEAPPTPEAIEESFGKSADDVATLTNNLTFLHG